MEFRFSVPPRGKKQQTLRNSLVNTGHNYIGTEHILLGLLREGEGVAARVLETLGADPAKIRTQVCLHRGEKFRGGWKAVPAIHHQSSYMCAARQGIFVHAPPLWCALSFQAEPCKWLQS